MKRKFLILICLILFIVSIASVSAADNLNRADDGILTARDGGTFTDLQKKIDAAPEGSTVTLENNYVFVEAIDSNNNDDDWDDPEDWDDDELGDEFEDEYIGNPVRINKPLTINGNGFTIDGNYISSIFDIDCEGKVVLNDITFINAFSDGTGGAISAYSDLTVNSCNFIGSSTKIMAGGAIYSYANLELKNCNFKDNMVGNIDEPFGAAGDFGGGAVFVHGRLTANGCTFTSNHAKVGDYAVYIEGSSSFSDCTFTANDNGVIYFEEDSIINGCNFEDNSASMVSIIGGLEGSLSVSGCDFVNNSVHDHGGIVENDGDLTVKDSSFVNNSGGECGHIIHSQGEKTHIVNTIFFNNSPSNVYPSGSRTENVRVVKPSHITIGRSVFVPGEDIQIDINLDSGATGDVIVDINGKKEKLTLKDNSAALINDNFGVGRYDMSISYTGDDSYAPSAKSFTVKVVEYTFRDLQNIIYYTPEGGVIELDRNYTYAESIDYNSPIQIEKNIKIIGNGYTLDGNGKGRIIYVDDTKAVFDNITFINGDEAIYIYGGDVTIQNCRFTSNHQCVAGYSKATISDCIFSENTDRVISLSGEATVSRCDFLNNFAAEGDYLSCAIDFDGNLDLKDCTFVNNTFATFINRGLVNVEGDLSVSKCTFVNNGGDEALSGCIHVNGNAQVTSSSFVDNSAEYGAAIEIQGNLTVTDSNFENNRAFTCGGAIHGYNGEKMIVRNCVFTNNHVKPKYDGEAICSNFYMEVTDTTFVQNGEDKNQRTYHDVSKNTLSDKNIVVVRDADYKISKCDLIEKAAVINVNAPDVTKYYGGPERFVVTLKNDNGNPVADTEVKININGVDYTRTTDSRGTASMALGLPSKTYDVTTTWGDSVVKSKVIIKDTIFAEDFTKMHKNATQYYATLLDTVGNTLPENSPVEININGVFYTRYTNNKGVVKMNINLNPGTYILTAKNPVTGEMQATTITVIGTIVENHDLTKYYRNDSQYSIRLLGGDGKPVKAGVEVRFNINGVFYTRVSNDDGYVKMNINLEAGEYTITADYNGLMASNKITVLSVIETENLEMSYKDGSKFNATILDGQGKPYPSQNVTFNINGVFYDKVTDENGTARLAINLMAGEYIITTSYNGLNAANKVTISS